MCCGTGGRAGMSSVFSVKSSNVYVHSRKEFYTDGSQRDSSYCQLSQLAMGVVEPGRWHHLMVMMMMMAMMIVPSCYLRSPANSFIPLTLEDFHIFQSSSLEFLDPVAA